MNNKRVPLAHTVDGITGNDNISEMWREHYSGILNCVSNDSRKRDVMFALDNISSADRHIITPHDVSSAIQDLKKGKSMGHDDLNAEHFIHAHCILHVMLSLLFTACISHAHLPDSMMKSIIVPLVKNKTGDLSDKNNYRPIALVTSASKILEIIILNFIEFFIDTSCNQFGFKRKSGTDMCVYSLKNTIQYYRQHNIPVFSCFLDASKAFDRVNHWCLFSKLINRGVSLLIVRLLSYWYVTQSFYVKWDKSISVCFTTSNGVRQGGILSPRLFILYIDDLSVLLSNMNVGCYIDNTCMNHYFYADDMCLLAPSAGSLQQLINVCANYGHEYDILYNPIKSKCVTFLPRHYNSSTPSVHIESNVLEYVSNMKYLGVILSSSCKDDNDITRQLRCLYASANSILRKFACCSVAVKIQLLESYCCNFYCASLWCDYPKRVFYKLKVAYNNIFRKLLGFRRRDNASGMFVSNNIDTFDCKLRKICFSFRLRLLSSTNKVIQATNTNTWILNNYMWRNWTRILYIGAS